MKMYNPCLPAAQLLLPPLLVGGVTSTDVLLGLVPKTTHETCICITEVCFTTAHTVKRAAGH